MPFPSILYMNSFFFSVSTDLTVEFGQTSYSVDEGGAVNFTIVLSRLTGRNIELDFKTFDGSATCK